MPKKEHTKRSLAHEAILELPLNIPVEPWVISKQYNLSVQDTTAVVNGNECVDVTYLTSVPYPKILSITRTANPNNATCVDCIRNHPSNGKKMSCTKAVQ